MGFVLPVDFQAADEHNKYQCRIANFKNKQKYKSEFMEVSLCIWEWVYV